MSIHPFSPFPVQDAFDAETTRLLGEVFDSICIPRHDSGQPNIILQVIAKRIIEAAKRGERDPQRLRAAALDSNGPRKCDDLGAARTGPQMSAGVASDTPDSGEVPPVSIVN